MAAPRLVGERVVLRQWREGDLEAFASLNADPVVMEHFPAPLGRAESDTFAERCRRGLEQRPFGLWALEIPGVTPFAGFVGLNVPGFEAPFMPAVEVGWRLDRPWWGHGYASEAARLALAHGFGAAGLDEVVSFTAPVNRRSVAVMERLGMTHDPADDFDHPRLPAGHPLRRHVLYRLGRP
jgi:RimJ/RimL family protein N-acetyltransferase